MICTVTNSCSICTIPGKFSELDKIPGLVKVIRADPSRRGKHLGMWLRSAQDGRANAGQEAVRRGFLATRPPLHLG
jgi:hypothetical protein